MTSPDGGGEREHLRSYLDVRRKADATDSLVIGAFVVFVLVSLIGGWIWTPLLAALTIATMPAQIRIYDPLFGERTGSSSGSDGPAR